MAITLQQKKIKSADRVLEIIEMFTAQRQAVTVMEVARTINAPQSSTSELLGSLVRRGYLTRDRSGRIFHPTARIALLGSWVQPSLFRHGKLLPMMDELHEMTGEAVMLGSMSTVLLHHLHAVGGELPAELHSGSQGHPLHSPFGHALLSTMYIEDLRKLVHRLNAESREEERIAFSALSARVEQVGRCGYALHEVAPGWTGIAVLLPRGAGEEKLALGVVGRSEDIAERRDELLRTIRQAVALHMGPCVARSANVPFAAESARALA